ncbi:monovalent cation/H+ antiporter complex subunit F [Paraburkholderia rhizosphaerae]|uniref:Multisubunit sodium/proton antiporter MrpF subunit n=1 Tax=Paraburkholderia rhizosphaerae TaxID=480658 RepID=A0A4R8LLH5_9BURK|nr:monovalent cation/H+ antiporter complex subunit F [Paraburkholderia rhizosphaerae]TDY45394.1 multisubunit sodium/proton antiporter MrpF subunit [Paraburkholderia rhizosphaerae]
MVDVLITICALVLLMVAVGLSSVLRGPTRADRMMAAQLFGTGGIAALLLVGTASGVEAVVDVALTLAVLAAFASVAFVKADRQGESGVRDEETR